MSGFQDAPFFLNDEATRWVDNTLAAMSEEDMIGQLFCLIAYENDADLLRSYAEERKVGGVMCRPMPLADTDAAIKTLQDHAAIPMLIAANLEGGGNGVVHEGCGFGSPLQVAATDDEDMAARLGDLCGCEGAAVGVNWTFAPVADVDVNFRNPVTNTRTFGSDPDRVRRMARRYVEAVQRHGVAACLKHFPGDGVDERDQHLVASVNSLAREDWDRTYGAVFRAGIEAGALTVMTGHILQPACSRDLVPGIDDRDILPASLSYELTTTLLKDRLGFRGLVVTDASTMAGMAVCMPRAQAVPQAIAAGNDMFLFTRNLDEDFDCMREGVRSGTISPQRLREAVGKILALKAALQLPRKRREGTLVPAPDMAEAVLASPERKAWIRDCADKAITLVKEEPGVLPLSPARHRRILLHAIESKEGFIQSVRADVADTIRSKLETEGFAVERFDPKTGRECRMRAFRDVAAAYDLILYLANMRTQSNQTVVRIEWAQPMGVDVPVHVASVPTVFVSLENPYHLLDAPRVRTFINTYGSNDETLDALVEKLMGRSPFKGTSPVDPYCGMWDTRL